MCSVDRSIKLFTNDRGNLLQLAANNFCTSVSTTMTKVTKGHKGIVRSGAHRTNNGTVCDFRRKRIIVIPSCVKYVIFIFIYIICTYIYIIS